MTARSSGGITEDVIKRAGHDAPLEPAVELGFLGRPDHSQDGLGQRAKAPLQHRDQIIFAARQNRPGSACQNGSRLRIRISKSSAGAGARWRGALGQTCGRGGAGRRAGTGLQGAPRMRGCPSIPASLPPARCAGRGQGSRSDGRGCGRLALTPPRIPGTHGLPLVSRQRTSPPGMRACLLAKATPDERGTPKAERRRSAHSAASTENLQ